MEPNLINGTALPSAFLMLKQKKLSVEKWEKDGVVKANATVQVFLDYF